MVRTPSCIFEVDAALLLTLEGAVGPPLDSYLMGWQVWLVPVGEAAGGGSGGASVGYSGGTPGGGAGARPEQGVGEADGGVEAVGGQPVELEFRLHPPAGFRQPEGLSHHDLWDETMQQLADRAAALAAGEAGQGALDRVPLRLGREDRDVASLWELLEVFPAFGEDVSPEQVRTWAEGVTRRPALAAGYIDHERLGGTFKRLGTRFDLPGALREELGAG